MAVTSFIPQLWAGALLAHLDKSHIVANLVNRNYEGEIRQCGDTVKINQIGSITVKDYIENTDIADPEELTTTETVLTIDKQKYFNFQIDDVDKAQVKSDLMDSAMYRSAYAMADQIEKDILAVIDTEAGQKLVPSADLTASNVYAELIKVKVAMDKENVPSTGRIGVISPDTHALLLQDERFVGTGGSMAESNLQNGYIGRVLGIDLYMSNNIDTLTNGSAGLFFIREAVTFAEQITNTEAYRLEKRFADAVKGLAVYGTKVTMPKAVVSLKKTQA